VQCRAGVVVAALLVLLTWTLVQCAGAGAPRSHAAGWSKQDVGTSQTMRGISFGDATHGWAVGDGGAIVATADGGATWSQQSSGTLVDLKAVDFVSATHGWAVGYGTRPFPPPPGSTPIDMRSVILATTDGGVTWTTQWGAQSSPAALCLDGVEFVDALHGWAVGLLGRVYGTSDGGGAWIRHATDTPNSLVDVSFIDSERGWVVGSAGELFATSDGGDTWVRQDSGARYAIVAACFVDARRGWAAGGEARTVLATTSGGWADPLSIRPSPFLYDGVVLGRGLPKQTLSTVLDLTGSFDATRQGTATVLEPGASSPTAIALTWSTDADGNTAASGTIPSGRDGAYELTFTARDPAGSATTSTVTYHVAGYAPPVAGLPRSGAIDLSGARRPKPVTLKLRLRTSGGKPILVARPRLYVFDLSSGLLVYRAPKRFRPLGKGTYSFVWSPAQMHPDRAWGDGWRTLQLVVQLYDKKLVASAHAIAGPWADARGARGLGPGAPHAAGTPKRPTTTTSHVKVRW